MLWNTWCNVHFFVQIECTLSTVNCRRLIDHRIDDQGTVSLFKVWFFNLVHGQDGRGWFFTRVGKCGFTIQAPPGISHMWNSFLYFVQSTRGKVQKLKMMTIIGSVKMKETRGSIAVYRMPFNMRGQCSSFHFWMC